jgi:hypothetical protein
VCAERVSSLHGRIDCFVCALGDACKECDASRVRVDAARRDFFTQACASSSRFKQLTDLGRMLEERKTFLCLQEMDLEVREAILAEEQQRALHPIDEQDLSSELDMTHPRMEMTSDECATEPRPLS